MPLPNGDVILNDDWNHRITVVDPKTDKIGWQYGKYGVPGSAPGLLNVPDGMDLLPPYSLASRFASQEGQPPVTLDPPSSVASVSATALP